MADAKTTMYGDISPRTAAFASKTLLERGMHIGIAERFGQTRELPRRSSRTIKFRRFTNLAMATTPLAEGVTPPGSKLVAEDVVITLEQFGDFVEITDVIEDTHEDPVLNETMGLLGEQAFETLETIRFQKLGAGTQAWYMEAAGTAGANRAAITGDPAVANFYKSLRFIHQLFQRNKGSMIANILSATPNIGTVPIQSAYFGMCHSDLEHDFRDNTKFKPVETYPDSMRALKGEIGSIEHFRIMTSPLAEIWPGEGNGTPGTLRATGGNVDVYPIQLFCKNSYAIVPLRGKNSVTPMVLNPGRPRGGDPLGQRGTAGWKTYHTAGILNESWFYRIEVGSDDIGTF